MYREFSGHEPRHVDKVKIKGSGVAFLVGDCDGILYTTVRDGKTEKYIHKFKKSSRPLLAASSDGTQLYILSGEYKFTDRGIVDK